MIKNLANVYLQEKLSLVKESYIYISFNLYIFLFCTNNIKLNVSVFKTFLNFNSGYIGLVKLVQNFTDQLDHIRQFFQTQKDYHFYSSSVLLAYDAETLTNDKDTYPLIRISLIDFAHVTPANDQIDLNYLQGITNLWTLFQTQLLQSN